MRLEDEGVANKIAVLKRFFENYPDIDLTGFVVIAENMVRISKMA